MASTHIYPEGDTRLGGELKGLIEIMKNAYSECENLVGIMTEIGHTEDTDENVAWADLAIAFGFTAPDAGKHAHSAYSLINNAWGYAINAEFFEHVITMMG